MIFAEYCFSCTFLYECQANLITAFALAPAQDNNHLTFGLNLQPQPPLLALYAQFFSHYDNQIESKKMKLLTQKLTQLFYEFNLLLLNNSQKIQTATGLANFVGHQCTHHGGACAEIAHN